MKADLDLVRDTKAGDKSAFSELVRRHQRAIFRLALRFVRDPGIAEDITQESFVKAFQKLHLFEERSSFKSWLFRISINTAKNRLRSASDETVDVDDVVISVESTTEAEISFQEVQEVLALEVAKLPDRQRTALQLRVYEELSFQEIAQIMECPYDTAKANYRHAVLKLKKILSRRGIFPEGWEEKLDLTISPEPARE